MLERTRRLKAKTIFLSALRPSFVYIVTMSVRSVHHSSIALHALSDNDDIPVPQLHMHLSTVWRRSLGKQS